jgi:hypothetical protein
VLNQPISLRNDKSNQIKLKHFIIIFIILFSISFSIEVIAIFHVAVLIDFAVLATTFLVSDCELALRDLHVLNVEMGAEHLWAFLCLVVMARAFVFKALHY